MNLNYGCRCELLAIYMLKNNCTVREAAKAFGISKSTVHKDVTFVLEHQNKALYDQIRELLEENKKVRHVRGGIATKMKYLAMKTSR